MTDRVAEDDDNADECAGRTRRVPVGGVNEYWPGPEMGDVDVDAADHWDARIWHRKP